MSKSSMIRHGKKTHIHGYLSESVSTLTDNIRVDRFWVRVRVFSDNQKLGTGTDIKLLQPSRPRGLVSSLKLKFLHNLIKRPKILLTLEGHLQCFYYFILFINFILVRRIKTSSGFTYVEPSGDKIIIWSSWEFIFKFFK